MAYLTIARFRGHPERLLDGYEQTAVVMSDVGRDYGLLVHAPATTGDGLLIVNLWPSRDRSESAAGDARRRAVVQQHGLTPDQLRHEHHDVAHDEVFAPSGAANG